MHEPRLVYIYSIMLTIIAYRVLYHINGYSIDEQNYRLHGLLLNKKL